MKISSFTRAHVVPNLYELYEHEDILKNAGNQTVDGPQVGPHQLP